MKVISKIINIMVRENIIGKMGPIMMASIFKD